MRYAAKVEKDGKNRVVEFLDCPGCVTQADPGEDVEQMAKEALEGWLESHMANGELPPLPKTHRGEWLMVDVHPMLSIKIQIRAAREARGWTQGELAKRMGVTQPMVNKVEDPDVKITFETIRKVANALGLVFDPGLKKAG